MPTESHDPIDSPFKSGVGEEINVYSGAALLSVGNSQSEIQVKSKIIFSPRPRLLFDANGDYPVELLPAVFGEGLERLELSIPETNEFYSIYSNGITFSDPEFNGVFVGDRCLYQKSNVLMSSVRFHLTNFPNFFWQSLGRGPQPSIEITFGEWSLRIDPSDRSNDERDHAEHERSYLVSNLGKLRRVDGQHFSPSDYEQVDRFLSHVFSFLAGGFCGPFLSEGIDDFESVIWRNQRPIMLARARPSFNWFPRPFPENIPSLIENAWNRWQDPVRKEAISRAIDWYRIISDTELIAEPHLVQCQISLEMLSWVIVCEENRIISKTQFKPLSAATKIEKLLDYIGASKDIPIHFKELAQAAVLEGWSNAPQALVGTRNNIIHQEKRSRARMVAIDLDSKIQICKWAIWCAEISILFMLGYRGRYDSRVAPDGRGFPFVPWVDPSQAGAPRQF